MKRSDDSLVRQEALPRKLVALPVTQSVRAPKRLRRTWVIDSGCSEHMIGDKHAFKELTELDKPVQIQVANEDAAATVTHVGIVNLVVESGGEVSLVTLPRAYFLPSCPYNLLSVSAFDNSGLSCSFGSTPNTCEVRDRTSRVLKLSAVLNPVSRLYEAVGIHAARYVEPQIETSLLAAPMRVDPLAQYWHETLGHASRTVLKRLKRENGLGDLDLSKTRLDFFCHACAQAKAHQLPYYKDKHLPRATVPGERIHTDLAHISKPCLKGGSGYVTFIDDYSRHVTVRVIKTKDEATAALLDHIAYVEKQLGRPVKYVHSDRGGEYTSTELKAALRKRGILLEQPAAYHPASNGVAERMNRTLCESARAMLLSAAAQKVPHTALLWGEAVMLAAYVLNRILRPGKKATPYELFTGKKPTVSHLVPFGSVTYALKHGPQIAKGDKFASRTRLGYFVGYEDNPPVYRVFIPGDKKVAELRDVSQRHTRPGHHISGLI